ncbi:MAG: hypothetical protein IPL12_14785 [Bacteroidetes bacterium]|nr:hypothetical protein [Bacteroidota bacterium]
MFPNPSDGVFTIQLDGFEATETNTVIMNSVGQIVYQSTNTPNEFNFTLPGLFG